MNSKKLTAGVVAIIFLAVLGIGTLASAQRGQGYGSGQGMYDGYGPGNCPGYGGGYGPQAFSQLSEEKQQQAIKAREKFFQDTQSLRDQIFAKQTTLEGELAKEAPDAKVASKLQGEVSDLKAQFDQKRLDHIMEMKKIDPSLGMGFGRMRGAGGRGGYGGGPCWR